jgi:hypothetical protein
MVFVKSVFPFFFILTKNEHFPKEFHRSSSLFLSQSLCGTPFAAIRLMTDAKVSSEKRPFFCFLKGGAL